MRNKSWVLAGILGFYALLYIATKPNDDLHCDQECRIQLGVDSLLRKDRPYVYSDGFCADSTLCVFVRDTALNWGALSDTVCRYLAGYNRFQYRIIIRKTTTGDTLANRICP